MSLAQCKAEKNKRGAALVTGSKVQVSIVTEVRIWLCWSVGLRCVSLMNIFIKCVEVTWWSRNPAGMYTASYIMQVSE